MASLAMVATSCGFLLTHSDIRSATLATRAASSLTVGNRVLPSRCESTVALFFSSTTPFSAVPTRAAYSAFIEPPYFCASVTLPMFSFSRSRLVSSGAIAPMDSRPNSCVIVAACSALGSCFNFSRTCRMAPPASSCMALAISLAFTPSFSNDATCRDVAASPDESVSSMFLMPVAETSDSMPIPATVAPSAASGPLPRPATSPSAPMRFTTSLIFWTLAGPVLPR